MQLPSEKFKHNLLDLATLTGAIIVSLGSEYADYFLIMMSYQKNLNAGEKVRKF